MSVRQVHVAKRQPSRSDELVPDLVITAVRSIQDGDSTSTFEDDATAIVDALWDTLPGGTVDQIVIELLQRSARVLKVGLLSSAEVARLTATHRVPPLPHAKKDCGPGCDDYR